MRRFIPALVLIVAVLTACANASGQPVPSPSVPMLMLDPVNSTPTAIVPAPSPTPFIPSMIRLTGSGCCSQPYWSPDGQTVLFLDQPTADDPLGIYGISVNGGAPQLVTRDIGLPSPDGRYIAYLNDDEETIVQEVASGTQWVIPDGGRRVYFSPGSTRLAWTETVTVGGFDDQSTTISISNLDGTDAHVLTTVYGGGIVGWLDDDRLALAGKDQPGEELTRLFILSVVDGARLDLAQNQRLRAASVGPAGQWILYTVTFDPDSPEEDGLWVISTDASRHYKLAVVGSARWRDATHLLIIPMEVDAPSHRLWQFDAATGEAVPLTDPAVTPFRVQAGDWSVSPTGEYIVFLSADDQALWLFNLPPLAP